MKRPRTRFKFRDRRTGKVMTMNADRAGELMLGGLVSIYSLGCQMGLSEKSTAALLDVLREAVGKATPGALAAAYDNLSGADRDTLHRVLH